MMKKKKNKMMKKKKKKGMKKMGKQECERRIDCFQPSYWRKNFSMRYDWMMTRMGRGVISKRRIRWRKKKKKKKKRRRRRRRRRVCLFWVVSMQGLSLIHI